MSQNSSGLSIPIPLTQGGTAATSAAAALTSLGAVAKAGDTMTGALILNADPVLALGAATKQYADAISAGLTIKTACYASTTANLNATQAGAGVGATLTNAGAMAAFSTDGVSPPVNSRILVQFQTLDEHNGIYTLTTVGSGATNWVLTRAADFDAAAEIPAGALVIVNNGTLYETTSWVQTATVVTVDTDPIVFSQFTAGVGANTSLSNLITTSINQSLLPNVDITRNIGSPALRWDRAYIQEILAGESDTNELVLGAYDVDGTAYVDFISLVSGNTPTCQLSGSVTSVTQALGTDDTRIATTAFVQDAIDDLAADKANVTLNNLAAVAINTSLVSDTDLADSLGSATIRWDEVFAETLTAGHTVGHVLNFSARDVDGGVTVDFITATSANTPTCAIAGSVTGVTQAALDNSTKLATTAYVDAATGGGAGANTALSNLIVTSINQNLICDSDLGRTIGDPSTRWGIGYFGAVLAGGTAADVLTIGAIDTDTSTIDGFIQLTSGSTTTCVFSGTITGFTQAANTNNTTLATTAYADASSAARASVSLNNLSATAVNASISPASDNAIDLGDGTHRWNEIFAAALRTGTTAADTLVLSARDVDGAANTAFITLTANNTPTCAITGATITGGTVSGLASPIVVADGGTGVATLTTAYGTLCAGTSATGAVQTVATGTAGQVLVSAGNAALPAYGTAPVAGGGTGLSSTTAYAVICGGTTSTNPLQSIASVGTAGQVLTSNGAGALPTFQAAAGGAGALVYIASATASASATVNFDNNLSATYNNYLIVFENVLFATDAVSAYMRFGTGAGPTYQATNYQSGTVSTVGALTFAGPTTSLALNATARIENTSPRCGGGSITINNVNTATDKTASGTCTFVDSTAAGENPTMFGGRWKDTTVITSVQFLASSGNTSTGVYRLYGIVNS